MKDYSTYETRRESYMQVDTKLRYAQIKEILKEHKEPMTAKEVAVEMCKKGYVPTSERNFSSPRLTELVHKDIVELGDKKLCQYTGKMVCTFKLREEN